MNPTPVQPPERLSNEERIASLEHAFARAGLVPIIEMSVCPAMPRNEEKESRIERMKRSMRRFLLWKSGPLALILSILLWLKVLFL